MQPTRLTEVRYHFADLLEFALQRILESLAIAEDVVYLSEEKERGGLVYISTRICLPGASGRTIVQYTRAICLSFSRRLSSMSMTVYGLQSQGRHALRCQRTGNTFAILATNCMKHVSPGKEMGICASVP